MAVITSLGWGIISLFPMINARRPFFLEGRPSRAFRMHPGGPFSSSQDAASLTALWVFLLMFSFWLMNLYLYSRFSRMPWAGKTKNYLRYGLSCLLAVVVYYGFSTLVYVLADGGRPRIFPLMVALANNVIILVLIDLIILQRKSAQIAVENSQLKMNHAIAQHQHLKHQLQPHFLFNSLTTLKSLIKKQRPEAEEYLVRLADLLRASINSGNETVIPLRDELKLCVDYLEMQKVRFKEAFRYQITLPDSILQTGYLPIFSLQLLAENAIKHNAFTVEEPLAIQIAYQEPNTIVVTNNKKPKQTLEASSGIGLRNLSERYQVICGTGIAVRETDQYFTVELKLLLHEPSHH